MRKAPYFLAIQTGRNHTTEVRGVHIPIWNSEGFPSVLAAAQAIDFFCQGDPEKIRLNQFVILEVASPPTS